MLFSRVSITMSAAFLAALLPSGASAAGEARAIVAKHASFDYVDSKLVRTPNGK